MYITLNAIVVVTLLLIFNGIMQENRVDTPFLQEPKDSMEHKLGQPWFIDSTFSHQLWYQKVIVPHDVIYETGTEDMQLLNAALFFSCLNDIGNYL